MARREGNFEVVTYDRSDPDQSRLLLKLTAEEADTVAEILGAPRIAERFADLTKEVPGLSAGQIEVDPGSPTSADPWGRHGHGPHRSVDRRHRADGIASPPPSEALHAGDVLVVIGTPSGITGVDQIIHT